SRRHYEKRIQFFRWLWQDLTSVMPTNCQSSWFKKHSFCCPIPSWWIQGFLCMSPHVREKQIQVRPSQRKFDSPHTELEVIKASTFLPAYLNRQAITLLSILQVPDSAFVNMRNLEANDLDRMLRTEHSAM